MSSLKQLKKFLDVREREPDTRGQLRELLEDLVDRIYHVERDMEKRDMDTFRFDLELLKEEDSEIRRDIRSSVTWLKQARKHLASHMNVIRDEIKKSPFFGHPSDKTYAAFLKALLELDDDALFHIYNGSDWL